jgi:hypothetical protein
MFDPRRILVPALVCLSVAACDESPVNASPAQARNADPAGPLFEAGHMLGSGAFVDTTTSATTAATMDAAEARDTTGRGGHLLGSGA